MKKVILNNLKVARAFLIICCLFCSLIFNCRAQNSKVLTGDTTFWYKLQCEKCAKLNLPLLISSNDNFYFRFWTDDQSVDIWSADGLSFNGMVTSFTNSYIENSAGKPSKKQSEIFFKQENLDTALARKAYALTTHIAEIPTDKSIKGWNQGFDGIEYLIETSTASTYNFRTYWTPSAQDSSLVEAKKIQAFAKEQDSLLGLRHKYHVFATLKARPIYWKWGNGDSKVNTEANRLL